MANYSYTVVQKNNSDRTSKYYHSVQFLLKMWFALIVAFYVVVFGNVM